MNIIRTTVLFFSLLGISICLFPHQIRAEASTDKESIEDVSKEAKELLESMKTYTADRRDQLMEKAEKTIEAMDRRMEVLEKRIADRWEDLSQASRQETNATLKELRKLRIHVAEWYGSLKSGSGDAWDHLKNGFSDAFKKLSTAWEKAEQEFSDTDNGSQK